MAPLTPLQLNPLERTPVPIGLVAGWVPEPAWMIFGRKIIFILLEVKTHIFDLFFPVPYLQYSLNLPLFPLFNNILVLVYAGK
jgi:hypothetical protein